MARRFIGATCHNGAPSAEFLPRWPRSAWEGWFVIALPRRGNPVRWAKAHLFHSRPRRGFHPLSAVEGLESPGEVAGLVAFADRVIEARGSFASGDLRSAAEPFDLALPGRFHLGAGEDRFDFGLRDGELSADLSFEAGEVVEWARLAPLLRYLGVHSSMRGTLEAGGAEVAVSGLGVVEHAFGARLPFHPARAVPGRWHWDVLSFERDDTGGAELPPAGLATLTVRTPHLGTLGLRAGGSVPGASGGKVRARGVEYLETARCEGGHEHPTRWLGRAGCGGGELVYEARAVTPLSPAAPGGGFFGFEFEARLAIPAAPTRRLSGSGFCECGGNRPAAGWLRPAR